MFLGPLHTNQQGVIIYTGGFSVVWLYFGSWWLYARFFFFNELEHYSLSVVGLDACDADQVWGWVGFQLCDCLLEASGHVHFIIIYELEHCSLSVVGLDVCDTDQVWGWVMTTCAHLGTSLYLKICSMVSRHAKKSSPRNFPSYSGILILRLRSSPVALQSSAPTTIIPLISPVEGNHITSLQIISFTRNWSCPHC